jgi:hypothetical protein
MDDGRQNIQEEQSVRLIEGKSTSNREKVGSSAIPCYAIDRIHEYIMCIDCPKSRADRAISARPADQEFVLYSFRMRPVRSPHRLSLQGTEPAIGRVSPIDSGYWSEKNLGVAAKALRSVYLTRAVGRTFRTISNFRRIHLKALSGLFAQVLRLALKLGALAIDGSKIKSKESSRR